MVKLTRKDFVSENEVRWCPGCGDYAILSAMQKLLPELGLAPEKTVFISGIGCAGRFPYYMNCYGFHTIHGRAPAVATGLKLMREDLSVWIITGDGDGLSIGTNHLIHCLRRDLDVNILLFNNEIYGLTKGQFSPTSRCGQITKTSPQGVLDTPLNPLKIALASGAGFVARAIDKDPKHLSEVLKQAHAHRGASFVEIYQNCNIFNDGAFDDFAVKTKRKQNTVLLEAGKTMSFGEEQQWALARQPKGFQIVDNCAQLSCVHEVDDLNRAMALSDLTYPDFPVPIGIFYQRESFTKASVNQDTLNKASLLELYRGSDSWDVKA